MINSEVLDNIMESTLRINKRIGQGLAATQCLGIEKYIDEVIRSAALSFPPGLRYTGYRPATPSEELKDKIRQRRRRRGHELSKSDVYHVLYLFEYEGVSLKPRYIQLPYIRRGGIMMLRGSSYTVSPVLTDNIFSVDNEHIYMPITRSKLKFFKQVNSYLVDDEVCSVDVIYSAIFILKDKERNKKRVSLLMHYLLARHGLTIALKRYFNLDIQVGKDFSNVTHSKKDWVICRSRQIPPASLGRVQYIPSDITFAVPRKQWDKTAEAVIGSIFYIVDHEPDMMEINYLDDPMLWRRILPRFIRATVDIEKKSMDEMEAHMLTLDAYMDEIVRRKLQREKVVSEDIFDVFAHILVNFPQMTMSSKPASMLGKRLETVQPLMFDVVSAIFNMMFKLVKLKDNRLTRESIESTMDKLFKQDEIYNIHKRHGEVSSLNSATDCLLLSVTKSMIPQHKATRLGRVSKSSEMKDPAYALDSSQCLVSTYLFTTKSDPSGRSTINPFMTLTEEDEPTFSDKELKEMEALNEQFNQ